MKYTTLGLGIAITFFCVYINAFSQDIITLRSGDEIKAIVNEIDNSFIRYKKFENPTGPVYTLEKRDAFMIKYENGTKEVFEIPDVQMARTERGNAYIPVEKGILAYRKPGAILENNELLSKNESRKVLAKVPEALASYNKGQKLIKTGSVLSGVGLAVSFGVAIFVKNPPLATSLVAVSISASALIGSISTTLTGRKKIKKAVTIYNSAHPE
jgi:hypothetical protein